MAKNNCNQLQRIAKSLVSGYTEINSHLKTINFKTSTTLLQKTSYLESVESRF